jgi:hypothetical protein
MKSGENRNHWSLIDLSGTAIDPAGALLLRAKITNQPEKYLTDHNECSILYMSDAGWSSG